MLILRRISHRRAIAVGLAAVAIAFGWQCLTVRYNYGGNWTGLFCVGANQRVPPRSLLQEDLYAEPNSAGFDGQFYHYIAHDPWLATALSGHVDSPRLRYRRILVPGLAFLLAGGHERAIDPTYYSIVLGCVFLGVYWLSRFAVLHQQHALWGLLFLAFPATLAAIDRMVVDVALMALWAGFAVYASEGRNGRIFALLALAPLARETGLAMTAAFGLWALWQRKPARALLAGATVLPCLAWYAYLYSAIGPDANPWVALGRWGLVDAILHPYTYPWSGVVNALVTSLDYLAVAGAVVGVGMLLRFRGLGSGGVLALAAAIQGVLGLILVLSGSRDLWVHVYGYARVLSPMLILLFLGALARRNWTALAPLGMILPRMGLEFSGDTLRILRGLMAGVAG